MAAEQLVSIRLEVGASDDAEQLKQLSDQIAAQCREMDGVESVKRGKKIEQAGGQKGGLESIDWGALIIALSAVSVDHLLSYFIERLKQSGTPQSGNPLGYPLRIGDEEYTLDRPLIPEELPALRAQLLAAAREADSE